MRTKFVTRLRAAVAALLLTTGTPTAEAAPRAATATTARRDAAWREHDAEVGLAWIVGGVALFVFMAWAIVRTHDAGRSTNKMPD